MPFLIDTNVAIHLRDDDPIVIAAIAQLSTPPAISIFTLVELEGGVHVNPAKVTIRRQRLDAMLAVIPLIPFELAVVDAYARIVADLGFSRPRILDRLIAATAIVSDLTLITINAGDFRDVPGLRLEIWPAPAQ